MCFHNCQPSSIQTNGSDKIFPCCSKQSSKLWAFKCQWPTNGSNSSDLNRRKLKLLLTRKNELGPLKISSIPGPPIYSTASSVLCTLSLATPPPPPSWSLDIHTQWMRLMLRLLSSWLRKLQQGMTPVMVSIVMARKKAQFNNLGDTECPVVYWLGCSQVRNRSKVMREEWRTARKANIKRTEYDILLANGRAPQLKVNSSRVCRCSW